MRQESAEVGGRSRAYLWALRSVGVLLVGIFVVLTAIEAFGYGFEDEGWMFVYGVAMIVAFAVGATAALYAGGRFVVRSRGRTLRPGRRRSVLALGAAAGLAAAAPVSMSWSDGCNRHGGLVPLVFAPTNALLEPENGPTYSGSVTLVQCIDEELAGWRGSGHRAAIGGRRS